MFIGHYGPAFAAKPLARRVPLWLLFVSVQFLDFCWSALVLSGVEQVRIVPGFTQGSALDLYYMPFTHGLAGALVLSVVFGAVGMFIVPTRRAASFAVLTAAVFSHWLLDLIVHVPDLPLVGDHMKVGFGLWRHLWISLPLELGFLVGGAALYARAVPSRPRRGDAGLWGFVAAMAAVQLYGSFGRAPASPAAQAQMALAAYTILAALAGLVDWRRGTLRG